MKRFFLTCYKWMKMIMGRDVLHVEQNIGTQFVAGELRGYFNNMVDKVYKCENLDETGIPYNVTDKGEKCQLLVSVLQYGLGNYDLYLSTGSEKYLISFKKCVEWVEKQQDINGGFNVYSGIANIEPEYSAMTQGEAASLLLRAYKQTGEGQHLKNAKRAIDFMLKDVKNGGTTVYEDKRFYFEELFDNGQSAILNGWIFALFGLYDYSIVSEEAGYEKKFHEAVNCLAESLKRYDRGYWSNYNQEKTICSPFYHKLHISQLEALTQISRRPEFEAYKVKWERQYNNKFWYAVAFIRKAVQKLSHYNDAKVVIIK
ncbi:thioredoxin [Clostridium sp. AF15-17LB]|nr:thioredoxin [Clostridium sp. AF15-17LB]